MFERLFGVGLYGKLYNLLSQSSKDGYSCGNQINCTVSSRPGNKYCFTASIITSNPHIGDVDGKYQFFESKRHKTFTEALLSLTKEVTYATQKIPDVKFFRLFFFGSKQDVETYLLNYRELTNREEWLENAVKCDWRKKQYGVREQFENDTWTAYVKQGSERLNLLENSIDAENF